MQVLGDAGSFFFEGPLVLDPLALQVLQGKFVEGDTVVVDVEGGKLEFYKEEKRTKAPKQKEKVHA